MTWADAVRNAHARCCGGTYFGDNKRGRCKPIALQTGAVVCWWCNRSLGSFELPSNTSRKSSTDSTSSSKASSGTSKLASGVSVTVVPLERSDSGSSNSNAMSAPSSPRAARGRLSVIEVEARSRSWL